MLGPAKQPLGGLPRLGGPLLVNLCGLLSDSRRPLTVSQKLTWRTAAAGSHTVPRRRSIGGTSDLHVCVESMRWQPALWLHILLCLGARSLAPTHLWRRRRY